jgi:apolipoprotein N-acyltransferase
MQGWQSFPARCGIAVLSGLIYALAHPPLGWGWLVLIGVGGLLLALDGLRGTRARAVGFIHGLAVFAFGLSWLYQIFGVLVIPLWFVLAAFTALFADMQGRAAQRGLAGWKFAVFTAVNWSGWEFIRSELFPLKFPWLTSGLAVGPNALLPWIGVYGVGLLVVFCAALFAGRLWKPALPVFLGLVLAVVAMRPLPQPAADDPQRMSVGGLQLENMSLDAFLKGTREIPDDVRYVVWPEYAVPFDIRQNTRDWKLVQDLCSDRNITLTLGTQSRAGEGEAWRNIALTLDPSGVRGEHNKVHTVHFFDDGLPGATALPVDTRHGKVGTPVCFDCDYEAVTRRMTAAGAESFIVPIMDAESWTAMQHDQHAELFRIRAAENGRWMFVCATSGVSQLIDPHGQVHDRLAALVQGPLTGVMKRETRLTFYTRYGWLVPWLALGAAGIAWIALLLPRHRPPA